MNKTYYMDERGQVLRLIPTEPQEVTVKSEEGFERKDVKSYKKYDDGLIEIVFKKENSKRSATIKNDKTFGHTTVMFSSKNRVILRTAFDKKELDKAIQELHDNLPFLQAYVKSQIVV